MGHDPQPRETESSRLDSWKEIATFLHRDARTVRRWERERRLPVHRVPGGERSGVFAYVAELESWLHAAGPANDISVPANHISVSDTATVPQSGAGNNADHGGSNPPGSASASPNIDDAAPHQEQPVSAFHSLNSFQTTFVAEADPIESYVPSPKTTSVPPALTAINPALLNGALARPRHYYAVALLVLLSAAIGISAAVVRYHETRPVKPVAHRPNPEAQDLYLRGRYYWNLRTEAGLNSAVDLFTQSIVNDPQYAAAYAGLADAYILLRQYGHMPDTEAYPRALAAARQAIALDDSSPEAHRSLAFVLRFWTWDMAAAEKEYRRAIELNPNDSQSHHWYATALLSSGRTHEALTQIDIARSLEPQSVSVLADRGLILSLIDPLDPRAGIVALQQVVQVEPAFVSAHRYLSGAYLQLEDYRGFLAESRTAAELSHDAPALLLLARAQRVLAAQGPKPMLREMAMNSAPLADRGTFPAYGAAVLFGLAGDSKEAIRYLHLACDRRDPGFLGVENDPAFVSLRSSPEYNTLISRRDVALSSSKQPIAKLDAPELSK